jgi:hypothetical protein
MGFCKFQLTHDGKGIGHHGFVPRGLRVNGQFHLEVLKRLRKAERRKRPLRGGETRPGGCTTATSAHTSLLVRELSRITRLPSPTALLMTIVPCRLLLFLRLKFTLNGSRFQTMEEIEGNSTLDLRAIQQNVFQHWRNRCKRCIKM